MGRGFVFRSSFAAGSGSNVKRHCTRESGNARLGTMTIEVTYSQTFQQRLSEAKQWFALKSSMRELAQCEEVRRLIEGLQELRVSKLLARRIIVERRRRTFVQGTSPLVGELTRRFRISDLSSGIPFHAPSSESEWRTAVEFVVARRRRLLEDRVSPLTNPPLGRLLVYVPTETVDDGASQCHSAGFFDLHDAPPVETWVHISDGMLFAWIPEFVSDLANAGVEVNPVESIRWL